ncbi:DUF4349 domain-containing protein [Candidatus Woesearchaeota archaeon]|nr:DUF4349 domain-containing protein [Candidatus Woesearchaeota archaeon]
MTIKEQFKKIKENWVLLVLVLALLVVFGVGKLLFLDAPTFDGGYASPYSAPRSYGDGFATKSVAMESYAVDSSRLYNTDFAPEVQERMITKGANFNTEVERGQFKEAEAQLKLVIANNKAILLNENVYKSDYNKYSTYQGSYSFKVDSKKYNSMIAELKAIGEVLSFSENAEDITAQHVNIQKELEAEQSRLQRFEKMFNEAASTEEKIQLTDRIFDLERTIKYYKEALANVDNQVEYSTVYVQLQEKQSDYVYIAFTKFSDLLRSLVDSINSLLYLLFVTLPYVIVGVIGWLVIKWFRKKK